MLSSRAMIAAPPLPAGKLSSSKFTLCLCSVDKSASKLEYWSGLLICLGGRAGKWGPVLQCIGSGTPLSFPWEREDFQRTCPLGFLCFPQAWVRSTAWGVLRKLQWLSLSIVFRKVDVQECSHSSGIQGRGWCRDCVWCGQLTASYYHLEAQRQGYYPKKRW